MPAVKWCPRASWLQVAVMIVLCGAAILHYLPLPVGGFFLLGLQSAIMSPARRGFAKEVAGENVWLDGTIQNVHSLSNRRRSLSN